MLATGTRVYDTLKPCLPYNHHSLLMRIARVLVPVTVGVLVLEVCFRIYNPLPFRVRGDRIVLPIRQSYVFDNVGVHKLDPVVRHTKNSLGFRGPEPPRGWSRSVTILAIGGSTTESLFLSDGKTWTDELAWRLASVRHDVWLNNAGLDGQSTFGHLVLLCSFVLDLRPSFALFLIGTNDVERGDANGYDRALTPQRSGAIHSLTTFAAAHSEVAATAQNLARAARAYHAGFGHSEVDLLRATRLAIEEPEIARVLGEHRTKYLNGYRARVGDIVDLCRRDHIEPVLMTQPALFGEAVDPATGVDLRTVQVNGRGNGALEWRLLELYNDVTREVGARKRVLVVDLAREMPKDSRYFYDFLHFTNEGSVRAGDIVFNALVPQLPPPRP